MGYKDFKNIVVKRFKKRKTISKPQQLIYTKCNQIPMWNFDAIKTEDDYRYLVVGFTGFQDIEIPEDADAIYYELMNEYSEIDGNRQALDYYDLQVEVSRLEVRQKIVNALLETMCLTTEDKADLIEELLNWGVVFNTKNSFIDEMGIMERNQKGWLTKIKRKTEELRTFFTDDSGEVMEETTLIEQKLILEQILDKNHIDLKQITATEFIHLRKNAQETVNQKRKWQARN